MNRNTIIALLLVLCLSLGFSFYNASKTKKLNAEKAAELARLESERIDSTDIVITLDSAKNMVNSLPNDSVNATVKPEAQPTNPLKFTYFAQPQQQVNDYYVETNKAIYRFSSLGGYLSYVELKDVYRYTPKGEPKQPLVLYDGENNNMNIELMMTNQTPIQTARCHFFNVTSDSLTVTADKQELALRMYPNKMVSDSLQVPDSSSYIEYVYTFYADDYRIDFDVHFVNMSSYLYVNKNNFNLRWESLLKNVEKNYKMNRDNSTVFYRDNSEDVESLDPMKSDNEQISGSLKWVSFKQQFFTAVLIADSIPFESASLLTDVSDNYQANGWLKGMRADVDFRLDNLDNAAFDMSMFIGPNQYKLLKEYDLDMERQVPIGWSFLLHWINRLAVIPIFNWLESYGLNYGIIILILTIILKLVLFPIAYKTYLSSARMRLLKPEIDEINEKYKGDSQEMMMKKQQATMKLYKSAGVNPMAGCLPMLLQMPILIALFRFFPSAYELRQQPFLWADDLSTYDSVLDLSFNIPFYGDHVSLFCLLMTAATLIYTWLNNKLMTTGNNDQMKMMKVMMYIMPILFLGMFNSFASGLTYYYLLVNLITFLQMFIFRLAVKEDKLRAKLKANMLKPVKKSKFQLKMEEAMRQQQQMQQNKKR